MFQVHKNLVIHVERHVPSVHILDYSCREDMFQVHKNLVIYVERGSKVEHIESHIIKLHK